MAPYALVGPLTEKQEQEFTTAETIFVRCIINFRMVDNCCVVEQAYEFQRSVRALMHFTFVLSAFPLEEFRHVSKIQ